MFLFLDFTLYFPLFLLFLSLWKHPLKTLRYVRSRVCELKKLEGDRFICSCYEIFIIKF